MSGYAIRNSEVLAQASLLNMLEKLFGNIKVMKSTSKIVGTSKTLHFLLPRLVMPIDRTYTLNFLYGNNKYDSTLNMEIDTFKEVFGKFRDIAMKLSLSKDDVDNQGWNTTVPKLINNAIIGYMHLKRRT